MTTPNASNDPWNSQPAAPAQNDPWASPAQQAPAQQQFTPQQAPAPQAQQQFTPQQAPSQESQQPAPQQAPAPQGDVAQQAPAQQQFTPQQAPAQQQFTPQQAPAQQQFTPQQAPAPQAQQQFTPQQAPAPQGNSGQQAPAPQGDDSQEHPRPTAAPLVASGIPTVDLNSLESQMLDESKREYGDLRKETDLLLIVPVAHEIVYSKKFKTEGPRVTVNYVVVNGERKGAVYHNCYNSNRWITNSVERALKEGKVMVGYIRPVNPEDPMGGMKFVPSQDRADWEEAAHAGIAANLIRGA